MKLTYPFLLNSVRLVFIPLYYNFYNFRDLLDTHLGVLVGQFMLIPMFRLACHLQFHLKSLMLAIVGFPNNNGRSHSLVIACNCTMPLAVTRESQSHGMMSSSCSRHSETSLASIHSSSVRCRTIFPLQRWNHILRWRDAPVDVTGAKVAPLSSIVGHIININVTTCSTATTWRLLTESRQHPAGFTSLSQTRPFQLSLVVSILNAVAGSLLEMLKTKCCHRFTFDSKRQQNDMPTNRRAIGKHPLAGKIPTVGKDRSRSYLLYIIAFRIRETLPLEFTGMPTVALTKSSTSRHCRPVNESYRPTLGNGSPVQNRSQMA